MESSASFVKVTNQRADTKFRIGMASGDMSLLDDFINDLQACLEHATQLRTHRHEIVQDDFSRQCIHCGAYEDEVQSAHERHDLQPTASTDQ